MKTLSSLAKKSLRNLKPCKHGADTFDAAERTGFKREEILDFSSSVNPLGPSTRAIEAIKQSLELIPSYPDSNSTALREAIAKHYNHSTKENVIVGNGSTELIYLFADTFMEKGNTAIVPTPSFGEYENAVRKTGEKVKYLELKKFNTDSERFFRAMTKKTKIIFLCNPNNPTSILANPEQLEKIIQKANEKDMLVFLDEDFLEFVENEEEFSMIPRINDFQNLFILRSFTKIYGLTGLRVGYGIASRDIISILLNAKIPWNVNCLGQVAATAALEDQEHLKNTLKLIKEEKEFLVNSLRNAKKIKIYPPDANFIFIDIRKTGLTSSMLKERMLSHGVLIRDCSSFAGLDEYFIRVAVKTRLENEKLISVLERSFNARV